MRNSRLPGVRFRRVGSRAGADLASEARRHCADVALHAGDRRLSGGHFRRVRVRAVGRLGRQRSSYRADGALHARNGRLPGGDFRAVAVLPGRHFGRKVGNYAIGIVLHGADGGIEIRPGGVDRALQRALRGGERRSSVGARLHDLGLRGRQGVGRILRRLIRRIMRGLNIGARLRQRRGRRGGKFGPSGRFERVGRRARRQFVGQSLIDCRLGGPPLCLGILDRTSDDLRYEFAHTILGSTQQRTQFIITSDARHTFGIQRPRAGCRNLIIEMRRGWYLRDNRPRHIARVRLWNFIRRNDDIDHRIHRNDDDGIRPRRHRNSYRRPTRPAWDNFGRQ